MSSDAAECIYIFVRKDIPYGQVVVQACHAALEATRSFINNQSRYKIVCLGIKNQTKLEKVVEELKSHNIEYAAFCEPDFDWKMTSVATRPLKNSERHIFSRYKLLQDD